MTCPWCTRHPCPDLALHVRYDAASETTWRRRATAAPLTPDVGFLVVGDHCDRCGDTNYDEATLVCLTCTYPDDPCSRAFLDAKLLTRHRPNAVSEINDRSVA